MIRTVTRPLTLLTEFVCQRFRARTGLLLA